MVIYPFSQHKTRINRDIFLCLVHIEKCAGSSLHILLLNNYPNYLPLISKYKETEYFSKEQLIYLLKLLPSTQGIGGHRVRSYLDYESVTRKPVFYFTFLREPLSRYMSHINSQKTVMGIDWTIDSFISEPYYNNFMCYRLCGKRNADKAINVINKMNFIGLMEHYDISLLLLKKLLNIQINYENINVSDTKIFSYKSLSDEQHIKIKENNEENLRLYAFVKENIFNEQVQLNASYLNNELDVFLNQNKKFKYNKFKIFFLKKKSSIMQRIPMLFERYTKT